MISLSIQEGVPNPFIKLKGFRKQHEVTYPILSDEQGKVIGKFGFSGIPANVILDKNGKYVANPDTVAEIVTKLKSMSK